jgi:hypothetical protein
VIEFPLVVENSWKHWIKTILIFSIWMMLIEHLYISNKKNNAKEVKHGKGKIPDQIGMP